MQIKHIYIEPTSQCNLNCEMCSRTQWENESIGNMSLELFEKIFFQFPDSVEKVTFAGIGEPLVHPDIGYMTEKAKSYNVKVEIVTNGTLLDAKTAEIFVNNEIDTIWISLDSLDEQEYSSIRSGSELHRVLQNIKTYNLLRNRHKMILEDPEDSVVPSSKLGISFILMKKNLSDFKKLIQNAYFYGIDEIKATHLIPYDSKSDREVCYKRFTDSDIFSRRKQTVPHIDLPLMEPNDLINDDLINIFNSSLSTFSLLGEPLERNTRYCRFINEGCVMIRWDGTVSPCMALLHDNSVYQNNRIRKIHHCGFGNIKEKSLSGIYNLPEYSEFRNRVINFSFSPCIDCASCDLFLDNQTDCTGNPFPTCGGCLWSEGLFQCP